MSTSEPIAHFDWAQIGQSFEQLENLSSEDTNEIRDALNYLRLKLGEGVLVRVETKWKLRHPLFGFLGIPFNYAHTATRRAVVNWSKNLQALEGCENLGRVLADFERPNKCEHAYRIIEIGGALAREGTRISFEPASHNPESRKRADALVEYTPTAERFYLELSCQGLATRQLQPFGAMSACYEPLRRIDPRLRFSGKLMKMPADAHLDEIIRTVEAAGRRALAENALVEISNEDTLVMAICPADKFSELETWSNERDLSPHGFGGPPDDTNPAARLGGKIKVEQEQLPPHSANVLVVENNHVLSHGSDVPMLISELEEELYKYQHIAVVVVRGRRDTNCEEHPWQLERGQHRFERQVMPRHVEEILLLSNRFADVKPSAILRSRILSAFFGSPSGGLEGRSNTVNGG